MSKRISFLLLALLALFASPLVHADGDSRALAAPTLPLHAQECGACHTAYAPGLLGAASWQRLMANLPRHFGSDASLDAASTAQLSAWLRTNAATGKRAEPPPPQDRITRSAWFGREHREIVPAVFARPAIKSASNCGACHAGAAQGDFNEHQVRIPR